MTLYHNRQTCLKKYREKQKVNDSAEQKQRKPRTTQPPSEEQLQRILETTKEKAQRKNRLLHPQTKEEIAGAIIRLQLKLMEVMRKENPDDEEIPNDPDVETELNKLSKHLLHKRT